MMTIQEKAFRCCFYGAGIILSLVMYGLLQERIMTQEYNGEVFVDSVFLVMCNRVAAVVMAVVMVAIRQESYGNNAPIWKYAMVSSANVFASSCQYESLKYVSFPVQMLGKSFKMMPVMLWGMAISGKVYGMQSWLVAAGVTLGVTEFLLTGPTDSSDHKGNSLYGLGLLVVFLALDGLTSTLQEKLFKEHKTSKWNQILYINMLSTADSLFTLVSTDTLGSALSFLTTHQGFGKDVTLLSLSAVVGQYFIYSQVQEFGALVLATTMNVRQVVSILVSYISYGHYITGFQISGLCLVFFALFYKSVRAVLDAPEKDEQLPLSPGIAAEDKSAAAKV
ncbi:unnamed protein product [Polarella glacialis]|uniref:Uncharacterized protein n=1 Tax=Polarella glacialis TaxID=89957 RepID=A0A813LL31_POLGL|nr:unnamed protein product [Polarella glacialis]